MTQPTRKNHRSRCVEKTPEYWILGDLTRLEAVLAPVLTELMARGVEIEPLLGVLLTVACAGVRIMKLDGKSRFKKLHRKP